ncbi:MAG: superoxide dismutase family protein [Phormidesmis sp.]
MQTIRLRRSWLMKYGILALLAVLMMILVSCQASEAPSAQEGSAQEGSAQAGVTSIAQANVTGTSLAPTITGQILIEETAAGLKMQGALDNVSAGMHGFHIHEGESCAEDGKAAGGHFNPRAVMHGYLPSAGLDNAHAGDLGNYPGNDHGSAEWTLDVAGLTLSPGEFSVANHAFILHADPDDLGQPTGNAGERIACGIIQPVALEN